MREYDFSKCRRINAYGLLDCDFPLNAQSALAAHEQGAFAWYDQPQQIKWWKPKERAVFFTEKVHISRSTRKDWRQSALRITFDHAFPQVIAACATAHGTGKGEVWLFPEMQAVYGELHEMGVAHSVEVWDGDDLVGGAYGVALDYVFCAESMFHYRTNASKIALWALAKALWHQSIMVMEAQMMTPHLHSLGAILVDDKTYQAILNFKNPANQRRSWRSMRFEDLA